MLNVQVLCHPRPAEVLTLPALPRTGETVRLLGADSPFLTTVADVVWTPHEDDHDAVLYLHPGPSR